MSDLAEFLLARIAEDEAAARTMHAFPMGEVTCPCGQPGRVAHDVTFIRGASGAVAPTEPLEITHVVGIIPPTISVGYVIGTFEPTTRTHVLTFEQSQELIDNLPLPASAIRVLAECEAKRRIIDFAFDNAATIDSEWGDCCTAGEIRAGGSGRPSCYGPDAASDVLKLLAQPYSDHPDFDPSWRVAGGESK